MFWKIYKATVVTYDEQKEKTLKETVHDEYTVVIIEGKKEKSNSLRFNVKIDESGSNVKEINFGPFYYYGKLNEIETLIEKDKVLKLLKEYLTEEKNEELKNKFVDKIKYVNKLIKLIKGDGKYDEI